MFLREDATESSQQRPSRFTFRRCLLLLLSIVVCLLTYRLISAQPRLVSRHSFPEKIFDSSLKPFIPIRRDQSRVDKAQSPATCSIIIRLSDGALGNRMFLFASAYGLARLHQCELYVAPWILNDLRSVFQINLKATPVHLVTNPSVVLNRTDIYGRYSACTLFTDLFRIPWSSNFTHYEMIGFYQAYGYFERYRDEINELFQFNAAAVSTNVLLVEQLLQAVWNESLTLGNYTKATVPHAHLKSILTKGVSRSSPVTWIGIHIRRGDFLTFFKIDTSLAYLDWAMNYYRRKYVNCRFLVASDDKKYVQANLGNQSDVFVIPMTFSARDDLAALALCEHTIVTAGTFGWWAAWLAGGDVLHDLNYPVPFQNCVKETYFPPWFLFPQNSSSLRWKPAAR